jgi:CRP/FNR family transcriptional regulator
MKNLLNEVIPIYKELTTDQQVLIENSIIKKSYLKGDIIHNANIDCIGPLIIKSGEIRAYMISSEGKEVTLYKLSDDVCLFSASCLLENLDFDLNIIANSDVESYLIPLNVFKKLNKESLIFSNYITSLLTNRFSTIMNTFQSIMFTSVKVRLINYLLSIGTSIIYTTHEQIASDIGTAREVVSRNLKQLEVDKVIKLQRNKIIIDKEELQDYL